MQVLFMAHNVRRCEYEMEVFMENKIVMLPVRLLHPHEQNPRKDLGDLTELTDSVRAFGVMQNLTVVPYPDSLEKFGEKHYTILAGHRRHAASKAAGLEEVPCVIVDLTPLEQLSVMMTENMQRSALTVEEQGYGFQMMLNLGASFEQIQERTGVSRRRIKTALTVTSLDKDKLRSASERIGQLSLALLEKLSRIEDVKKRNEILGLAGTYNFDFEFRKAINLQETSKVLPELKKKLKELGAKKVQGSVYGGNYDEIPGSRVKISQWKEQADKLPASESGLCYDMDPERDEIRFYRETKAKRKKKTPEEVEQAKRIEETWTELDALTTTAFQTRQAFIEDLAVTKERREVLIKWAMRLPVISVYSYIRELQEPVVRALGVAYDYDSNTWEKALAALDEKGEKVWPVLVWCALGDGADRKTYGGWRGGEFPRFAENKELKRIYTFLEDLGYVKSDVERQLMNGTHELYRNRRGMR